MTRQEAKELLPIIQAFADGKTVQLLGEDKRWEDLDCPIFGGDPKHYRVKPEPKYRPFKSQKECWQEMLKHEPFGWIIDSGVNCIIHSISNKHIWFNPISITLYTFKEAFDNLKFADGTPFGIKKD